MGILKNFDFKYAEGVSLDGGGNPPPADDGGAPPADGGTDGDAVIGKGTFYEGIDKDIYSDPSLKAFMDDKGSLDGKNIIKSYIHAKRQMGADKVVIPGEHSSDDEKRAFLHQIGLPKDSYELAPKEKDMFQKEFVAEFGKKAHEIGIMPTQAQKMFDWYTDKTKEDAGMMATKSQERVDNEVATLKNEWGEAYDKNLNLARNAFDKLVDPEAKKVMKEKGMDSDLTLIRMFAKIGKDMTSEDPLKGTETSTGSGVMTPTEADDAIKSLMAEPAYWDNNHVNHSTVVAKVQKLYAQIG